MKKWYWQLLVGLPFMPWLMVQHIDFTWEAAKFLGWGPGAAGVTTGILTFLMAFGVVLAFGCAHGAFDD